MSVIKFTQWFPSSLVTSGALMATATGTGSVNIVFAGLINVAQSRIKCVVVGNTIFRQSGTNPEITGYTAATGTFACVDIVDVGIPCVAFYTPI